MLAVFAREFNAAFAANVQHHVPAVVFASDYLGYGFHKLTTPVPFGPAQMIDDLPTPRDLFLSAPLGDARYVPRRVRRTSAATLCRYGDTRRVRLSQVQAG
jgi:hypothetical protein